MTRPLTRGELERIGTWPKDLMKPENGQSMPKTSPYDDLRRFAWYPTTMPIGIAVEQIRAGDALDIDPATGHIRRARADDDGRPYETHQPVSNMPKEVKPPRVTIAGLQAQIAEMAVSFTAMEEQRDVARAREKRLVELVLGEGRSGGDRYAEALARITTFHQLEGRELGAAEARVNKLSEERDWLRSFVERMSGLTPKRALRPGESEFRKGDPEALCMDMGTPGGDNTVAVPLCREHMAPAYSCRGLHR